MLKVWLVLSKKSFKVRSEFFFLDFLKFVNTECNIPCPYPSYERNCDLIVIVKSNVVL